MPSAKSLRHYEFFKKFKKSNPQPCYLIYGEEYFLREKVLATIIKAFSTPGAEDFDQVSLYGDEEIGAEAIENLEMLPFLGSYKITIIRDFHKLKNDDKILISEYCKNPSSSSILILVSEKIDKRKKAEKEIFSASLNIECKKPYNANDIKNWLESELRSKNKTMNPKVMNIFANSIEPDYMLASNELEKLIIYTKDSKDITEQAVYDCVGYSKTNKIFDLQNSLGNSDLKKSILIVENMLENNESGVFVIVMLSRYFSILWKIQVLRKRGFSGSEISAKYLNDLFYSFRSDYINQAQKFSISKLREIFDLLLQADIDLKSIAIEEKIILEILLYKICKK